MQYVFSTIQWYQGKAAYPVLPIGKSSTQTYLFPHSEFITTRVQLLNWPPTHRKTICDWCTDIEGDNPCLYFTSGLCWIIHTAQHVSNTENRKLA